MRLEEQEPRLDIILDQSKLLEQLERDYIFLKEPQSRSKITPILKKDVKSHPRYRISSRQPVNLISEDKKRELDKLAQER